MIRTLYRRLFSRVLESELLLTTCLVLLVGLGILYLEQAVGGRTARVLGPADLAIACIGVGLLALMLR